MVFKKIIAVIVRIMWNRYTLREKCTVS